MAKWEYAALVYAQTNPARGDTGPKLQTISIHYPGGKVVKRWEAKLDGEEWTQEYFDKNEETTEPTERWLTFQLLNELGADGWELVGEMRQIAALTSGTAAAYYTGVPINSTHTFKRRVG